MDLFGKEIKTVRCSFTQDLIPAGEVVEIPERPMLISSYEEADAQLFETDFENLQLMASSPRTPRISRSPRFRT